MNNTQKKHKNITNGRNGMNYAEVLNEFINICPTDEPIFLEDC